jgi:hypothetical protein
VSSFCFDPIPFDESNVRAAVEPRTGVYVLGPLCGTVIRAKHVGCARSNLRETLLSLTPPEMSDLHLIWSYCESPEMAETLRELLCAKYLRHAEESRARVGDDGAGVP